MSMGDQTAFNRGDIIFKEGSYGSSIYKVVSGQVAVYAKYGTEAEKLLTELRAGDYFGEMAVIEITTRSATVVAAEDGTRVLEIDATDLGGYLKEHGDEMNGIARHLSRRLRELTMDYTEVCDTLRELGRLDTSKDRVGEGLFSRIKKFARVYLLGQNPVEAAAEPVRVESTPDEGLALHGMQYRAHDLIFREGDRSDCMYYIHEGRLGVYSAYGTEKQKLLTELGSGAFFGEMGLFERRHRTATLVALEDNTFVEAIYEDDLSAMYQQNPAMAMLLLQHLSSRLRKLTQDYLKACRLLSETEKEIEENQERITPEMLLQAEQLNRLLLVPEMMY